MPDTTLQHPLDVGALASCVRRDGSTCTIEVIERKKGRDASGDGGSDAWSYYVHFQDTDRRLDDWVKASQLSPHVAPPPPTPAKFLPRGARGDILGEGSRRATRNMKRKIDVSNNVQSVADEEMEKEHEESTKVKNVKVVELGIFEIDAWYFSPYPGAFAHQERLYICPFSLKYFKRRGSYIKHLSSLHGPKQRCPPGLQVYRAPAPSLSAACLALHLPQPSKLTLYEVDGGTAKVYCQCLCLLAKLFLDHKTLYYDVDPFLFYVLCEEMPGGEQHIAGYFSKEKSSAEGNNIACILVLPPHQRKGYGKLLIDLAYNITMREGKLGSPEKPLSDLGQLSFRSYWTEMLLEALASAKGNLTISSLASRTAIQTEDIIATLQSLNLIRFWKGQHVISVSPKVVEDHMKANSRKSLRCEPHLLTWQPPPGTVIERRE